MVAKWKHSWAIWTSGGEVKRRCISLKEWLLESVFSESHEKEYEFVDWSSGVKCFVSFNDMPIALKAGVMELSRFRFRYYLVYISCFAFL